MGSSVPPIEIGSLTTVSPSESQFIGSSSGIFFVNTVQRAFAISRVRSPGEDPQPDDGAFAETYIGGVDADDNQQENEGSGSQTPNNRTELPQYRTYGIDTRLLGQPPSREHASRLIQVYFRVWHPLFPFLHGPTFLRDVEAYYTEENGVNTAPNRAEARQRHCRAVTFQCIFNVAALDRPDLRLTPNCSIRSATELTTQLCSLATKHDIPVLQALLAGQVYLIATMSLHAASTVGGLLLRLTLHGGLHRCPCRYSQISSHDADIRKRIFWSAYAADRYLSQALGLPLGIQDSDIDVCIPGSVELHRPVQSQASATERATAEVSLHLPDGHPALTQAHSESSVTSTEKSPRLRSASGLQQPTGGLFRDKRPGEDALAHYVAYGRLTGRALEMLHKSLNVRTFQYSSVLELTSDIHSFWNSLPQSLQDLPSPNENANGHTSQNLLGLFFTIIYQQLILLVNRPFLSLTSSSLEFRLSLQTCIGSSRIVISTLRDQASGHPCVSWPGTLSVTWMSGLILAFACALGLYPVEKGFPEINSCLQLLKGMSGSISTAKHCHSALKTLLDDLSSSHYGENLDNFTTSLSSSKKRTHSVSATRDSNQDPRRSRLENNNSKRQRSSNLREGTAQIRVLGDDCNAAESVPEQDGFDLTHTPLNYAATVLQPGNYATGGSGVDNTAQFWIQQSGVNFNTSGQPAAYAQDIFSRLSCENLLQFDESFQAGFWNNNDFPGP
ncbi:Zn(II)2Cys6 transcription factor [Cadophora sp. MPI-SDFR-AT-0126]|nr:Zn(II)2Cys6 transcription factor [Leotiomycetes sp. MPI-SDFR-AT-0126]